MLYPEQVFIQSADQLPFEKVSPCSVGWNLGTSPVHPFIFSLQKRVLEEKTETGVP